MKEKRMTSPERRRLRQRKKANTNTFLSTYKLAVIVIVIVAAVFFGYRGRQYYLQYQDMQSMLQQEKELRDENERLHQRKDSLNDKEEIAKQAREQFGLVKPGEVPYRK